MVPLLLFTLAITLSTDFEGSGAGVVSAIATDREGNIYVAGTTRSSGFPVTPGAFQTVHGGGNCPIGALGGSQPSPCPDAFVAKFDASGTKLLAATYLGGSSSEAVTGLAVDAQGNAYLSGHTGSPNFPFVQPLFDSGVSFVAKLKPDLSALVYSTRVGGFGAVVSAIAVDAPGNLFFAGRAGGGFRIVNTPHIYHLGPALFRTSNGGATWAPVHTGLTGAVYQIVHAPSDPQIVYASGSGISKSVDGGATWKLVAVPGSGALAVDPTDPGILYYYGEGGLWRSTDGAATWHRLSEGVKRFGPHVYSIAVDPRSPSTIYAAAVDGIWKSPDRGDTWTRTTFPSTPAFLVAGAQAIHAGTLTGLYRSADGGATWQPASGIAGQILRLAIDPLSPTTVYAIEFAPSYQLFKSTDSGTSWTALTGLPPGTISSIAARRDQLAVGIGNSVAISSDGGRTWTDVGDQLPGTSGAFVALDPGSGTLFAGSNAGSPEDALIGKINPEGTALVYSAQLGGSGSDVANSIAVDAQGRAYIAGFTDSPDFTLSNPLQRRKSARTDGFVAILGADGVALPMSTYLGGDSPQTQLVSSGPGGAAYVLQNGILKKVDPGRPAAEILASGHFGTLAMRDDGVAFLTGSDGGIASLVRVDTTSRTTTSMQLPSFSAAASTVDPNGALLLAGYVTGVPGIRLLRVADVPSDARIEALLNAAAYRPAVAPGAIVSLFGSGLAYATASARAVPLPNSLADTRVTVKGIPAPLYYVSPRQINLQIPPGIPPGPAVIELAIGGLRATRQVDVSPRAVGIFTQNASGAGAGAILHASDYAVVTSDIPAAAGDIVLVYATGLGSIGSTPSVEIAGRSAEVVWHGPAPGFPGLDQINVKVPAETPAGEQALRIETSNTVTIAIR